MLKGVEAISQNGGGLKNEFSSLYFIQDVPNLILASLSKRIPIRKVVAISKNGNDIAKQTHYASVTAQIQLKAMGHSGEMG